VSNGREVAHLTEALKQKVQARAQRIRRYEKGKPSLVRIRCIKKALNILQKPGHKEYRGQRTSPPPPTPMADAETSWKSLWGEAQHNERTEWIRRE